MSGVPSGPFADWIGSQVAAMAGGWSLATDQILANFAAMRVANPVAEAPLVTRPVAWTWADVLALLSDASWKRLRESGFQDRLIAEFNSETPSLASAMDLLTATAPDPESTTRPIITGGEEASLRERLTRTEDVPDAAWSAEISLARKLFGRDVTAADILYVRPATAEED
ncbi:hypothetical protein [Aquisphaera insulae]|uniref:hypothetical protein n=1 Tax=Aquisphaera insulae TaxID=2712864 RepID=UPI0013ED63D0|nr:hypothetical protein [Aquisphaera insulae]